MKSQGSNTMSPVANSARVSPLTRTVVVWTNGSTSVSIQGPIGLNVSLFLLRQKDRSACCHSRALTSLPIVQPNTDSWASARDALRSRRPRTATTSPSASKRPVTSGGTSMASPCPTKALFAR